MGEFNVRNDRPLPDGSVQITLTKRGDPHVYKLVVRNLYQPDERVLGEETLGGD